MRNKVSDLNNILFAQLERLNANDLTPEQLIIEVDRSNAIQSIASTVIESNKVTVEALKVMERSGMDIRKPSATILEIGERNSD